MGKYLTLCCFGLLILVAISGQPVWSGTGAEPGNIRAERPLWLEVAPAFDNGLSYQTRGDRKVAGHRVMDRIINSINQYGLLAIFGLLMFGIAGLPVPDELILEFEELTGGVRMITKKLNPSLSTLQIIMPWKDHHAREYQNLL